MSAPIRQEIFLQRTRIAATNTTVLQYDSKTDGLSVWKWPIDTEGRLITPSDLRDHRRSHQFLGPCCMCPLTTGQPAFVEAAIYMATSGRAIGEYVVECAMGKCGYIILIERLYDKRGVHVKAYQTRDKNEPQPPAVLHISEHAVTVPRANRRPLKRSYALLNINSNVNDNVNDIPIPKPKAPSPQSAPTAVEQLLQLDAARRPGLTAFDFQTLFTRCECGTITTKEVFHLHHCRKRRRLNTDEEIQLAEITQAAACPFKQLMLLNCSNRPGLTDVRFQALFVRCTCGIITTQSAFKDHYCIVKTWQRT